MKYDLMSRRMLLQGVGTATLAIPFLPSLLPRQANAAALAPSKYVHLNSSQCLPRAQTYPLCSFPGPSYPQPAGTNPNSVPWIQKDPDTKYQSLQAIVDYQGKLSWSLDEKWNPFVRRMNLVTNAHAYVTDNKFNSSVSSTASSGPGGAGYPNANGPSRGYAYSVDWLIEQALFKTVAPPQIPTLRVHLFDPAGENCFQGFSWGTIAGVETRIPMINDVAALKAKLGAFSVNPSDPAIGRRKARIDSVLADYTSLMNSRRIASLDKQRLSDAADLWRGIEGRMQNASEVCSFANLESPGTNWRLAHQLAMDAALASLACGVTKNVAYGLIQGGDNAQEILGVADSRVNGEGSPSITDPYYQTIRWRSDLVTYFLTKMDSLKDEVGQSLLNSCLTVWAHTTSNGNHGMLGHSLIVAGGNGKLDLGWHVDAGAAPVNRFHLTNMLAMGLGLADIEKGGHAGFGEYASSTVLAAGGIETSEKDFPTNDPRSREYDMSKRDHFFEDSERRKPFAYLK